jgi:hypothetical protein
VEIIKESEGLCKKIKADCEFDLSERLMTVQNQVEQFWLSSEKYLLRMRRLDVYKGNSDGDKVPSLIGTLSHRIQATAPRRKISKGPSMLEGPSNVLSLEDDQLVVAGKAISMEEFSVSLISDSPITELRVKDSYLPFYLLDTLCSVPKIFKPESFHFEYAGENKVAELGAMGDAACSLFCDKMVATQNLGCLRRLRFVGVGLNAASLRNLSALVKECRNLIELDLSGNDIGNALVSENDSVQFADVQVGKLINEIMASSSLCIGSVFCLGLMNCRLSQNACFLLLDFWQKCGDVVAVCLDGNMLSEESSDDYSRRKIATWKKNSALNFKSEKILDAMKIIRMKKCLVLNNELPAFANVVDVERAIQFEGPKTRMVSTRETDVTAEIRKLLDDQGVLQLHKYKIAEGFRAIMTLRWGEWTLAMTFNQKYHVQMEWEENKK